MKIIAESAFNHNGKIEYLKELALVAKQSKADYFTVQVMNPDDFCVREYSKSRLYHENSFTDSQWIDFFIFCKENKIDVIPCVLEESSFNLCYNLGYRLIKLHATDITNIPFLESIKSKGDCKVILETQCSTFQDIECGMSIIGEYVEALFHGFSNYPTELEDLNLNAIKSLQRDFPHIKYGLADHSPTVTEIPLMALGMGLDYLEKHITLTRNNRNMDYQVSLYPEEFSIMTTSLNFYGRALGRETKHPVEHELAYRKIIFKKVVNENTLKRDDKGDDFLTHEFQSFDRKKIGIALIARLKSQRLKKKVLKPFIEKTIIEDLFKSLQRAQKVSTISLCTSNLPEDLELYNIMEPQNRFAGHPISVLDRMLSYARKEKIGGIFRVTGDNPFTDPTIIDEMIDIFLKYDLDYVRVNNVPFGISAELFSTSYLWNLYLKMDNPLNSEYLSWFVLNDSSSKKGCINFIPKNPKTSFVNLSVDYPEDYERVLKLIFECNYKKVEDMNFETTISHLNLDDIMDENKSIKLPESTSIKFKDYLKLMNDVEYRIKLNKYEK